MTQKKLGDLIELRNQIHKEKYIQPKTKREKDEVDTEETENYYMASMILANNNLNEINEL